MGVPVEQHYVVELRGRFLSRFYFDCPTLEEELTRAKLFHSAASAEEEVVQMSPMLSADASNFHIRRVLADFDAPVVPITTREEE